MARGYRGIVSVIGIVALLIGLVVCLPGIGHPLPARAAGATFYNPISDVFDATIVTDGGFYYLIGTSEVHQTLQMRRSSTIAGLRTAPAQTVWSGPATGLGCCRIESPHLEKLSGTWYIYLSVSDGDSSSRCADIVLQGNQTDPLGPYTWQATLKDVPNFVDTGVIGPSVTQMPDGRLYFTTTTFGMYIQPMSNPLTFAPGSSMVQIANGNPTLPWEGGSLEISYPLLKTVGGQTKVFVPYTSENGVQNRTTGGPCWSYCIGMFTNTDGNLTNPGSWTKSTQPVLTGGLDVGIFRVLALGTFKSLDGTEDWMVYNASDAVGTNLGERDTFVQKFTFNADGTPNFGRPAKFGTPLPVPSGETGSPPAVAPGSVLLNDSFSGGTANWTPASGTWGACNGAYCASGSGENVSFAGSTAWADYTIQATVITDNAPPSSGVNVLARAVSSNQFYNLELHSDAQGVKTWAIAGNYSGAWQTLAGGPFAWEAGVKYWLRFNVNGDHLTGLVSTDGAAFQQLGSAYVPGNTVASGDYGQAGLRTWGGLTARFESVTVTSDQRTYGFYSGAGWRGLTIDAGGSPEANKQFCVDQYADPYCLGGWQTSTTSAIDTSGVPFPVPAAMYQTERYNYPTSDNDGSFQYVIGSLKPGTNYQIRLHFAEIVYTTAGRRVFNVLVNGTQVLTNFDKVAAAGGPNKAVVREFTANASSTGDISIQFTQGTDPSVGDHNPTVSALEVSPAVAVAPYSVSNQHVTDGTYTKIYDPSRNGVSYYINDHAFIRGSDGTWHMFGITDTGPPHSGGEQTFAHATAPSLTGTWTRQPDAMTVNASYGETVLWAPYVLQYQGTYYMFYAGGGTDPNNAEINLATSTDLTTWTRLSTGPLFRDGYLARDPMVLRVGNQWVMYYTATDSQDGSLDIVAYRTSTDLTHWSNRYIAFKSTTGAGGNTAESPFVVSQGGAYYLFTGPRGAVDSANNPGATVYKSLDPLHFNITDRVGHMRAHAPEIVQDVDGRWYISHAGWGEGGLWLSPLNWNAAVTETGFNVVAPTYRATIQSAPTARLTDLAVPAPNGSWREMLEPDGRGTQPSLGVGAWGATDRAGPAASSTQSPDGLSVTLSGVPLGSQPVTVDWTLKFAQRWFDCSYTWHVNGPTTAGVQELSWSIDAAASPTANDDTGANRNGDVSGFPLWVTLSDGTVTTAIGYRNGSSWSTANRWYGHGYSNETIVAFQPVWSPSGTTLANGTYAGGTWRIGLSAAGNDSGLAQLLSNTVNS